MSALSLHLPESLHQQALELAKEENISVNQLITLALTEKISALMSERFLQERAKGRSRDRFEHAMSKVADAEPVEDDRLPQA